MTTISFLSKGVLAPVTTILYDPEAWTFTPAAQQQDPVLYEQLAAQATHAHHLQFAAAPVVDLLGVNATGQRGTLYDQYLADGYAAAAASAQLHQDVEATKNEVSGYWLNIPSPGPYTPRVAAPDPEVAVSLLNQLWLTRS